MLKSLDADSPDTINEAESVDVMSPDFPELFARRVAKVIGDKVTDTSADLAINTVIYGVGAFFRLSWPVLLPA